MTTKKKKPKVKLGPTKITIGAEATAVENDVRGWIDDFLNDWDAEAIRALAAVPMPSDPESKTSFYLALGGNLTWAATCLLTGPEMLPVVASLSFAGAIFGSGALSVPDSSTDQGKVEAGRALAKLKDAVRKKLEEDMIDWVAEVADLRKDDPPASIEDQKRAIWSKMFPKIDYDHRSEEMYEQMEKQIRGALSEFNMKWAAWQKSIRECEQQQKVRIEMLWGYREIPDYEGCRKQLPFDPKLNIQLPGTGNRRDPLTRYFFWFVPKLNIQLPDT